MRQIQFEGIDPTGKGELIDVAQYGNVLHTLWHWSCPEGGTTSYTLRLEHSNHFKPDGLAFEDRDHKDIVGGLFWASDLFESFFCLSGFASDKEGSEG